MSVMEKCIVNIKEVYRDRGKVLSPHCVKLELVVKRRGEHFLTNMHMLDKHKVEHFPIAYSSIFSEQETTKKKTIKKVLIEGSAGTGKTTVCISISKGWANGDLFQEYDLLLFLPLNQEDIALASSLSTLIEPFKLKVDSEAIASHLHETNGQGVLVVADGWNELDESKRQEGSFLHQLLVGNLLSHASVIVTSRPSASFLLHKNSFVDRFIEIRGFCKESMIQYVRSKFSNDKLSADDLLEKMDHNSLIRSICTNPLSCTCACHLCRTCVNFPGTMTTFCTKIVLEILNHNLRKNISTCVNVSTLPDIDALPQHIQDWWWRLCKLAFLTIENNEVDTSQFQSFQYGIDLIGMVEYVPKENSVSVQFLHPCYHEYLAALHLVRQPVSVHLQALDTITFQQCWKYFFGLYSQLEDKSMLKHVIQALATNDQLKCLLCHCAFEATAPDITIEVINSLGIKVDSKTITHFGDPKNAHDCDAILYVIANMQGSQIDEIVINFKACNLSPKQIGKLADILSTKSGKLQVKDLDLSDNNLSDVCVAGLFNKAKNSFHCLEKLFVRNNCIKEEGIQAIVDVLSCKKVIQLDISLNSITRVGLELLHDAVSCDYLTRIEILFMQGCLTNDVNYNTQYLTTLSKSLLTHCQYLRRLDLSGNDFGEPETPCISKICMQFGRKIDLRLNREYMPDVDKSFVAVMEDSIRRKGTIDHTIVHGVVVGPGRSGKNSLMNRLMNEGPPHPDTISPSTGVLENVCKVEVKKMCTVAAAVNNLLWRN